MALKQDVLDMVQGLNEIEARLSRVAELIPNPERAEYTEYGRKIGLRDCNGKQLRVGDEVSVHGSERYGTVTGHVCGAVLMNDDGKQRVHVLIPENDRYYPSVGRVTRVLSTKGFRKRAATAF